MPTDRSTRAAHLTPWKKGQSGNPKGRTPGIKSRPSTLPMASALAAVELSQQGHSEDRIAKLLNAKPEAVKEALGHSRKLLELFAPEFAQHWLEASKNAAADGDHKPAMAALQSIKVVEPVAQTYDTGAAGAKAVAAVKVELHGFTFAGLPTQADEKTIDVKASTEGR